MSNSKIEIPVKQKEIIEGLLNRVKSMSDDEFKTMLSSFQKFHKYSFFNKCLIYASGGSQVAGFNKWKEMNRWVKKKDQHKVGAIQILAPSMLHQVYKDGDWEKVSKFLYEKWEGEKRKFPVSYFAVTVFDIQDTDGQQLQEPMTEKSNIGLSEVLGAAERLGYSVESRPMEFSVGGYISSKNIYLNSNRQESANVGTLVHELAHGELGHTDTNSNHTADIKEQQAETVTFLVCQELGIERKSEFYLKAWGASENIMTDFAILSRVADKLVREIRGNAMRFIIED
jgi:hypothetical protein